MTGWPLATTWIVFVTVVGLLAENERVSWPVAFVLAVAALFIALTSSANRPGGTGNRRNSPGG